MDNRVNGDEEDPENYLLAEAQPAAAQQITDSGVAQNNDNTEVEQDGSLLNAGQDQNTNATPVAGGVRWDDEEFIFITQSPTTFWASLATTKRLLAIKRIFACSFAGLFVVCLLLAASQTASLVRNVDVFPHGFRIAVYVAVGLLWLSFLSAMVYAIYVYSRMTPSPRISLAALDAIGQRSNDKRSNDATIARTHIKAFLKSYPTHLEQEQLLKQGGMGEGAQLTVKDFYSRLHHAYDNDAGNTRQWIERVDSTVLTPLDAAADQLIRRRAIMAGLKTAISPRGVIDSLIVLTHTWLLVGELCKLYSLRPSAWETCYILGFVGLNALISDKGDDAASDLQTQIAAQAANFTCNAAAVLIGMVASRAAEGTVNGLLIHRLGQQLKSYLRPIRR